MAATSPVRAPVLPAIAADGSVLIQRRPPAQETGLRSAPIPATSSSTEADKTLAELTAGACARLQESMGRVIRQAEHILCSAKLPLHEDERASLAAISDTAYRALRVAASLQYCAAVTESADWTLVDCNELVCRICVSLGDVIEETGANVTWTDLPRVRSIAPVLAIVFRELIVNAINYRSASLPDVRIAAEHSGGSWLISFDDNSIGIDPAHRERVFEPFYTVAPQAWRPGLGLTVARMAVGRLGGTIRTEPSQLGGCRFQFSLPIP
jgi:light-regulated signal transduction histidine kinase (bacteriophytochrome)